MRKQRTVGIQRLHQVIGVTYGNVSLYPYFERFLPGTALYQKAIRFLANAKSLVKKSIS